MSFNNLDIKLSGHHVKSGINASYRPLVEGPSKELTRKQKAERTRKKKAARAARKRNRK